jgi:CubicO group peptidase (beta-lactamase class C family)
LGEAETPACIAVGVVREKSTISFGCSSEAGPVALDNDSLFEIGSITKGLTGLVLADMVRRGEVKLDDPVSMHSRQGAKLPTRGGKEITLRHLVTHTSGCRACRRPSSRRTTAIRTVISTPMRCMRRSHRPSSKRDIGLTSVYSNFGFMWLSEMLARRAGKPYEALLAERVLIPLGMTSTSVAIPPERQGRMVKGHDGLYHAVSQWDIPGDLAGVGGVRSSISDMVRLGEALSGKRATPIDETIALALTPLHRLGDLESHVAYGWMMRDRGPIKYYWHNGGTGGFRSALFFDRQAKSAAVVLADSVTSFDDLARHLVDPVMPLMRKRVALSLDPAARKEYVGAYELRPGFVITVWEDGDKLMSRATGQSAVEYFRDGTDSFFLRVVDARIVFNRGADGKGREPHAAPERPPGPGQARAVTRIPAAHARDARFSLGAAPG